jgi:hypothetical protein
LFLLYTDDLELFYNIRSDCVRIQDDLWSSGFMV